MNNIETDAKRVYELEDNEYPMKQTPIKVKCLINSLDYNMNHRYRGHCLLFDIENFHPSTRLSKREGSQVDSTGLYNLFRSMSFEVSIFKDLTAKKICNQLEYFSKLDHSNNDCFACCILTHGEHGQLWGSDTKFSIDKLFSYFLGDKCRSLVGKPKIFFIQACQGQRLDHGVPIVVQDHFDSTATQLLPTHADFLIAYSTLPGFYSWRNTQEGSWYMQALIKVLNDYHNCLDLITMLTVVNKWVAYNKSSNATTTEFNNKKQIPCIMSMLTGRVFLKPKQIGDLLSHHHNNNNNNIQSSNIAQTTVTVTHQQQEQQTTNNMNFNAFVYAHHRE